MKRCWIAVLPGAAAIISLAVYLFMPELGSLIWHGRHGSHARLGGLEFQVPDLYSSKAYPEKSVLYIISVPGRARNYFKGGGTLKISMISLFRFQAGEQFRNMVEDQKEDPWAAHGYRKRAVRPLTLAGAPGRCIEYLGPAIWNGDKDVQVHCQFDGGWMAHFDGTETGLRDFLKILQTATRKENV